MGIRKSRYPGPGDLAGAQIDEVEQIIHSLGFL
jgi:hypothetical protein